VLGSEASRRAPRWIGCAGPAPTAPGTSAGPWASCAACYCSVAHMTRPSRCSWTVSSLLAGARGAAVSDRD